MSVSGILCNYCGRNPNATYVSKYGGLAACAGCKLSVAGFVPATANGEYLIHWRKVKRG